MIDTDLREQMIRAIGSARHGSDHLATMMTFPGQYARPLAAIYRQADAALAVAEPIIRADERKRYRAELVARARKPRFIGFQLGEPTLESFPAVAEWIEAQE